MYPVFGGGSIGRKINATEMVYGNEILEFWSGEMEAMAHENVTAPPGGEKRVEFTFRARGRPQIDT